MSCYPEETVEDGVLRCLRFAFGYQNAGHGPYELRLHPRVTSSSDAGDAVVADAVQRIYKQDATPWNFSDNDAEGSYRDVPAGTATFHHTHGHWHYDNIAEIELFQVDGGRLRRLRDTAKRGTCAHDWVLVDFDRWYQDERFRNDSSRQAGDQRKVVDTPMTVDDGDRCNSFFPHQNVPGQDIAIALSPGWGDVYGINNSDNYVRFPIVDDGEFLLRIRIDGDDEIEEAREDDNVGYAHFSVAGDTVTPLERGRGADPWDPDKRVLSATGLGE